MKISYADLYPLRDQQGPGVLSRIMAVGNDDEFTIAEKVKLGRFCKAVLLDLRLCVSSMSALYAKFGEPVKDQPGAFRIPPDNCTAEEKAAILAKFNAELDDLQKIEIDLPVEPLPVALYEKLPLTVADLVYLEKFIVPL